MARKAAPGGTWASRLIAAGLILGGWKVLTMVFPPMVFPPIPSVLAKLWGIVTSASLRAAIFLTMQRMAIGLSIGLLLGGVLGALMGVFARVRAVLSPIISLLQTVPPVSWVVMALLWFGFNGKPAIFIIVTATLPVIAFNISEGFTQIDGRLMAMAQVYHFSSARKLRYVVVPSIAPYFKSALRISLGSGWKIAVMGEVLTTSDGIGGMIKTARLNIEPESVIAWSVILVLLFYLSDGLFALLMRPGKERRSAANKRLDKDH